MTDPDLLVDRPPGSLTVTVNEYVPEDNLPLLLKDDPAYAYPDNPPAPDIVKLDGPPVCLIVTFNCDVELCESEADTAT